MHIKTSYGAYQMPPKLQKSNLNLTLSFSPRPRSLPAPLLALFAWDGWSYQNFL